MAFDTTSTLANLEAALLRLDQQGSSAEGEPVAAELQSVRHHLVRAIDGLRRLQQVKGSETSPMPKVLADPVLRLGALGAATPGTELFRTKLKLKPVDRGADGRDDLTRTRGIDPALERRLVETGVTSFARIAAWGQDDVRRVSAALGLGRLISHQNWIEQAAMLRGPMAVLVQRPVAVSLPPAAGPGSERSVSATSVTGTTAPAVDLAATGESNAEPLTERLDLIRGIDWPTAMALFECGVTRWAEIANWKRADVDRVEASLRRKGQLAKQNWVEQAALLATGRMSAHARRMLAGEFEALVPPPPGQPLASAVVFEADAPPVRTTMQDTTAPVEDTQSFGGQSAEPEHAMQPLLDRMATLDQYLADLVPPESPIASVVAVPRESLASALQRAQTPAPSSPVPANLLHIEDEEFQELSVGEAEVVIIPRGTAAAPQPADRLRSDSATRGLISRLKRANPLRDIDRADYAAYRGEVEEATVEIVKPVARRDRRDE